MFANKLDAVQRDFLLFRNMYWCTEVSNQAQGRELFDLWSLHLNTRPLFDQVNAELREATELVSGWRQQWLLSEQNDMHRNLEWVELFIVAAYAIEAMIGISHLLHEGKTVSAWALGGLAIGAGAIIFYMLKLHKHPTGSTWRDKLFHYGRLAVLALLPLFFGGVYWWEHKRQHSKTPLGETPVQQAEQHEDHATETPPDEAVEEDDNPAEEEASAAEPSELPPDDTKQPAERAAEDD
ncbi:MAG: hypothetical protein O3C40_22145 [Planctomycetota bacterium]|nr:hypothetical protein [Planctomycetota bacterium]